MDLYVLLRVEFSLKSILQCFFKKEVLQEGKYLRIIKKKCQRLQNCCGLLGRICNLIVNSKSIVKSRLKNGAALFDK